jgi:hypothetical protein
MSRSVVLVAIYLDEDSQKEHMATYLIIKKEYHLNNYASHHITENHK